jgi:uracil-DNA glycosylase
VPDDSDLDTDTLRRRIATCRVCAASLPAGPRPIVQFSTTAKILVVGQAPGAKVHASGVPWQDGSGERLREWMGIDAADFYDAARVALMPMGFCYPGKRAGGDLPPRSECAPLWHGQILAALPEDRLTLLVGAYAQAHYLPRAPRRSLTEAVRAFETFGPALVPLPHPAWRVALWMKKNPWFAETLLPRLKAQILARLSSKPRSLQ